MSGGVTRVCRYANVGEDQLAAGLADPMVQRLVERVAPSGAEVVVISANIESEIASLEPGAIAAAMSAALTDAVNEAVEELRAAASELVTN